MKWYLGLLIYILIGNSNAECQTAMTQTAVDAALNAGLIQTGLSEKISQVQAFGEKKAKKYIGYTGLLPVVELGLGAYKIVREQQISFPIHQHNLILHTNQVQVQFHL